MYYCYRHERDLMTHSDLRMIWCICLLTVMLAAYGLDDAKEAFTASAARRAALLATVRTKDTVRDAAKTKGPVLTIVADGQPMATIVCVDDRPANAPRYFLSEMVAAKMLQEWVKLMSGAELPLAKAPAAEGINIYVGKAALDAGLKLADITSKSNEGLRVKCDGRQIFIAGQTHETTIRAVGRFLEEEFGCRYLADAPWGKHYPEKRTLTVLTREFSERPGFQYRRIWGPEGAFVGMPWKYWNGEGGIGTPMAHSWGFLSKDDFEKHPEWFRLDENGKRIPGPWYNLGHPEVRKRFLEWAVNASDNGKKGLSFSPPDDYREDFPPEAKQYDNPSIIDPTSGRVSMTDRFLGIVNEAATELYKLNPTAIHGFYAYSDYSYPPTKPELQKLSPNLCIWIAPIRFSRYHPLGHPNSPSIQELTKTIDGWSRCASMLGFRGYNHNLADMQAPYSKITIWAHDLPYLHQRGFIGASLETPNDWELYGPHTYLSIRLAYDPRLDPWEIMADYWDKAYGPAAEVMEQYWMEIDTTYVNLRTESGSIHALPNVYTPERLQLLDGYLTKAEQLVTGRKGDEARVRIARRGLVRTQYWRKWYDAMNQGDVDGANVVFIEWHKALDESIKRGDVNIYARFYLDRFVGRIMWPAWEMLHPKGGRQGKMLAVLPDEWKYMRQQELEKADVKANPAEAMYDDAAWPTVKTFTNTLSGQGYPQYLGEMWYRMTITTPKAAGKLLLHFVKADRYLTVYVDGKQVNKDELDAARGATIDVTNLLKPGATQQLTVKLRSPLMYDIALGGILAPVYLIEQAE